MNKPVRTVLLIVSCALALLVSGCLQPQALYIGNKVTAEKVALRKDASQVGTWETFDLKIAYKFAVKGDILEISGQAELGDHQKMVYDHVRGRFPNRDSCKDMGYFHHRRKEGYL